MAEARQLALWGALAATLAGAVFLARQDDEPESPPPRRAAPAERAPRAGASAPARAAIAPPASLALERLPRPPFAAADAARIAAAWEPPPPPPPPPRDPASLRPPPPKPPPLPFRVIGRFDDGEKPAAIVLAGTETLVLRAGDIAQRQYRVDAVDDKELRLTYLPLQLPQSLPMRGTP